MKKFFLGTALAAVMAASIAAVPAPAAAQQATARPSNEVTLSIGTGRLVRLDGTMSDLFVANDAIADVQVRSANQIYIFGKTAGETTVYATNSAGKTVYSATVRVGNNIDSIDGLLAAAMPNAQIQATPMNGVVLLTGTVANPADAAGASTLVQSFVGEGTKVVSRLRTATPLQVMLKVKIAEVSRSLVKEIGVNLASLDSTGGFLFGIGQGRPGAIADDLGDFTPRELGTSLALGGSLFGLDIRGVLDLAETDGRVTTLAEPNLTALSGETASFLAGGEFPIPISQSLGAVTVEYKSYGVGLAFTPTVLEDGRISMRVRPEVSEISAQNSIKQGGYEVPSLTTRRTETTVELGSGQSFMIGGLLQNSSNDSVNKAPWLGDLPIIGALFRSNSFRRSETELVIVVTPYLVKPVSANQIALPTDGYRTATDVQRVLLDKQHDSQSGAARPAPVLTAPRQASPVVGSIGVASPSRSTASPGFSFKR